MKSPNFEPLFVALRSILQKHRGAWNVQDDSPTCYSLAGTPGPAALQAWRGKMKRPIMPVAWVQVGKAYVSFHLMGLYGNARLVDGLSSALKHRMQGKTCFNFKRIDETLFRELDAVTDQSIAGFKKAGFVVD